MTPKIMITFLIAFFPVIVDTAGGLAAVDPELLRLARVMRGNAWRTFWKVRLPSALPQMFAGFKVASTLAVVGAVVGEFVGADRGSGLAADPGERPGGHQSGVRCDPAHGDRRHPAI